MGQTPRFQRNADGAAIGKSPYFLSAAYGQVRTRLEAVSLWSGPPSYIRYIPKLCVLHRGSRCIDMRAARKHNLISWAPNILRRQLHSRPFVNPRWTFCIEFNLWRPCKCDFPRAMFCSLRFSSTSEQSYGFIEAPFNFLFAKFPPDPISSGCLLLRPTLRKPLWCGTWFMYPSNMPARVTSLPA